MIGYLGLFLLIGIGVTARADEDTRDSFLTPEVEQVIDRGLTFLAKQQLKDGSFSKGQYCVGSTSVAILAFLANGHLPGKGEYGLVVEKGIEYLLKVQDPGTGYIGTSMYEHGFATLVLADVYGEYQDDEGELEDALDGAVRLIGASQSKAGGWRYQPAPNDQDVSVTSAIVQALRACREAFISVPEEIMRNAAVYLRRLSKANGQFEYTQGNMITQMASTGSGALSMMACGHYNAKETLAAINYMVKRTQLPMSGHDGYYAAYYCVQAMYQAGGQFWKSWFPSIQRQIMKGQRKDGSFGTQGSIPQGSIETGFAIISLSISKGLLPVFQR